MIRQRLERRDGRVGRCRMSRPLLLLFLLDRQRLRRRLRLRLRRGLPERRGRYLSMRPLNLDSSRTNRRCRTRSRRARHRRRRRHFPLQLELLLRLWRVQRHGRVRLAPTSTAPPTHTPTVSISKPESKPITISPHRAANTHRTPIISRITTRRASILRRTQARLKPPPRPLPPTLPLLFFSPPLCTLS